MVEEGTAVIFISVFKGILIVALMFCAVIAYPWAILGSSLAIFVIAWFSDDGPELRRYFIRRPVTEQQISRGTRGGPRGRGAE